VIYRVPVSSCNRIAFELFRTECKQILKRLFDFLLFLIFAFFIEVAHLVLWSFLDKLDLRIVTISNILLVKSLTV